MKGMEKSYFWGMTLDGEHKEKKWEGTTTESTEDGTITTHSLCVRQVVLGADAKDGELNVIELECLGYEDKKQRVPVCVMKMGNTYVSNVEVVLEDCVGTFHLVKGSGPVHLSGTHQTETTILSEDVDDSMGEEEEDGDEEDEVDDVPPKKKAKKLARDPEQGVAPDLPQSTVSAVRTALSNRHVQIHDLKLKLKSSKETLVQLRKQYELAETSQRSLEATIADLRDELDATHRSVINLPSNKSSFPEE